VLDSNQLILQFYRKPIIYEN